MRATMLALVICSIGWPLASDAAEFSEAFDDDVFDSDTLAVSATDGFSFAVEEGKAVIRKNDGTGNGSTYVTTVFHVLGDFTLTVIADRTNADGNAEMGLFTSHPGLGFSDVFYLGSGGLNSNIFVGAVHTTVTRSDSVTPMTFRIRRTGETLVHEYDNGGGFEELQSQTHADLAGPASISLFLLQEFGNTAAHSVTFDDLGVVADAFTLCGNSTLEGGETCDDGDFAWQPGQSCNGSCTALACGDPDDSGSVNASDALFVLRTSVGSAVCDACVCDTDTSGGSSPVTAADALRTLRNAVGLPPGLDCAPCA